MNTSESLQLICRQYKLGEISNEECENRLEAILVENALQNNHAIIDEVDAVLLENLPGERNGNSIGSVFAVIINAVRRLQNSPSSELRDFFSAGYKNLLILCRRYQSNEFDVLEFRERLQTGIDRPIDSVNDTLENLCEEVFAKLDDIEYHCSLGGAEEIGQSYAQKMISAIIDK